MAAPMLLIVLELEEKPRVVTLARISDETRLADWLNGDPRVRELLADALTLVQESRADA